MKNYKFKLSHILIVAAVSVTMMAVATTLNNVSTVRADAVGDSSVVRTNNRAETDDNIVTGTWGTAPYTWNKTTGEITVGSGEVGNRDSAPWKTTSILHSVNIITFTGKIILPRDSSSLFKGLDKVTSINGMNNLDTSKVISMFAMFRDMGNLKSLDLGSFNTSNVNDMGQMFDGDTSINYLNISSFDTSKVTDMNLMFWAVRKANVDVSNFDTSNVTNMNGMFGQVHWKGDLNLSNFDTSKVTVMNQMFSNVKVESLNLSNFNTSNVISMDAMFHSSNIESLNLSSFNTSKVLDMNQMFAYSYLKTLDISNFDMFNVTDMSGMSLRNEVKTLTLGTKNKFAQNPTLPAVPTSGGYIGKWQKVKNDAGNNISNGNTYTSADLLTNYTPDRAGTYTWAKKSNNVSDIKDLYNNVKLAISYSAGMFNSQPGDSLKYKDEFDGRSINGALDYAYNSNNYNELIKVMHDSLTKAHESIGSLQVNETKAQELGLNVDQLKADLVKDSVPYDYSKDNDIDGINKQLDSFASTRAKYNKLVQQGVFDKSDYWTINK